MRPTIAACRRARGPVKGRPLRATFATLDRPLRVNEVCSRGLQYRSHHNDQNASEIVPPHSSETPSRRRAEPNRVEKLDPRKTSRARGCPDFC